MSTDPQSASQAATTITGETGLSLLDQAISVTKQTEPDRMKELLATFAEAAMNDTVRFDKNLTLTLRDAVAKLDAQISQQLAAVMHHKRFLEVEGTWRGLRYLVDQTETGPDIKIKVLNTTKREISKDFEKYGKDQSVLYKKIYEEQLGMPGGQPFGSLIGDYYFGKGAEDVQLLRDIAGVASDAFCPFLSAAEPSMFGKDSFTEMSDGKAVTGQFEGPTSLKWNNFRKTPEAAFVTLTMPRVLARVPYGSETKRVDSFNYEEAPFDAAGNPKSLGHDQYCWMNAAYALGTRLTSAFAEHGWCTAIRGAEGGGKVENLPTHIFKTDEGDVDAKCPTEIGITSRRELELSNLGFLPLCHYKNEDYAVFFGAQTTKKPEEYHNAPDSDANAKIAARLPYVLATSRFAHYLKIMARDKIGTFMEVEDCGKWLQSWISGYVNATDNAGQDQRAKFPLREALVKVTPVPGSPGEYAATAWLRPWLQFEALSTSMRLVAKIPKQA